MWWSTTMYSTTPFSGLYQPRHADGKSKGVVHNRQIWLLLWSELLKNSAADGFSDKIPSGKVEEENQKVLFHFMYCVLFLLFLKISGRNFVIESDSSRILCQKSRRQWNSWKSVKFLKVCEIHENFSKLYRPTFDNGHLIIYFVPKLGIFSLI